jgi:hypothetical protein
MPSRNYFSAVRQKGDVVTICPGCKNEIDPETCCCGDSIRDNIVHDNHYPVPVGCTCLYDERMKNEQPIENDPAKPEPIPNDPATSGQNPFWPGDKTLTPDDSDKDTKIPLVR